MKNIKILFFLIVQFAFNIVEAQEVIYSPSASFDTRTDDFSVVGKVGGKIFVYRTNSDGFFLSAHNDSMEVLATILLDFFPKKIYETKFISYSNKIIVLYQSIDGTKITQFAAMLDQEGRLVKGPLKLNTVRTGFFGPDRDYFSSVVSDDKKQIVVYSLDNDGSSLDFDGIWLDDQLNTTYKTTANFKADNDVAYGDVLLGGNGTLYAAAFTPTGGKDFADRFWILSLPFNTKKFNAVELPLNNQFAGPMYLKMDYANNAIYAGGFYSDKKNGNYEGVLFAQFNTNESLFVKQNQILFDEKIRLSSGEKNTKKALNNFRVKHMVIRKDGGFVLAAESFFTTVRATAPTMGMGMGMGFGGYYSPYVNQSVREYYYDDILTLSVNGNGENEWNVFVRKSQFSQDDGGIFSSFAFVNTGGALGYLFNDFNNRGTRIQLATIDGTGQLSMNSMKRNVESGLDWMPRTGKQVSLKEMIVPCMKRKQICFAKIVF